MIQPIAWVRGLAGAGLVAVPLLVAVYAAQAAHPDYSCNTCHVAHSSTEDTDVPLWNPQHNSTSLINDYASPTLDATLSEFDGTSRLCLSCHDGSSPQIQTGSSAHITSASQSHPVSFVYDAALAQADGQLHHPSQLPPGVLDADSRMQCTSCHDVHSTATQPDKALRFNWVSHATSAQEVQTNRAFCRTCHIK